MSIDPPRQVRDFTVIEPSGRHFRVRYMTRMERRGAFTMCMLLIVSGMLWWVQLLWVWRLIAGLFR